MLQIDRQSFVEALIELGHDPSYFEGLELSTDEAAAQFGLPKSVIERALEDGEVIQNSTGELSLIDAAWIHYCYKTESDILNRLEKLAC